jgi:SAM-dependent methyltransferase
MKEGLLEYLACPSCNSEIVLTSIKHKDKTEIIEGVLGCKNCSQDFKIVRGVPRFAELDKIEADKAATANNFGWEWQHFTQEDSHYAQQFLGWIAPVCSSFFNDKLVLEGGCGKGRHTQLAANWGARDVIGVDLSSAVESAFAATRHLKNAHIIQADIYQLPVKRIFDYAFSVGVLHHLPNPRAGFISIASKVRPGGHLSAWIYGAENNEWITRWISPLRETLTSRINPGTLLHLSKIPTSLLYATTKLIYGPLNRKPWGTKFAQHLFYNDYLNAISHFGWREQHTIVFDHLVAPTAFYISRAEFEDWWREIKASNIEISWHNKNSWRGLGRIIET